MIIKTVQTLVFEYPEDYPAEVEWNKKRDGDWVHQGTDTICSVYTLTNSYLIPTKAKHSFLDNAYFEADTPQTDCETCKHYKLACELFSEVCKYEPITQTETQNSNLTFENRTMLDCYNCKRYKSEDECVECRYEPKDDTPQTDCEACELDGKADACKICRVSNYEPQTDCGWK